METLTLILHKTKDTKNKVVYGTKDGSVIQSMAMPSFRAVQRGLTRLSALECKLEVRRVA